jgi:hypothetical protein
LDALLLVGFVVLISVCYGVVALAVLINLGLLPRPEPDQLVAVLYWRRRASTVHLQPPVSAFPSQRPEPVEMPGRTIVTLTSTALISSSSSVISSLFTVTALTHTATTVSLTIMPLTIETAVVAQINGVPSQGSSRTANLLLAA